MPKVVITGGAGFIGSHLAALLLQSGYEVVAVDDLSYGSLDNIASLRSNSRFAFVHGDITKPGIVPAACQNADYVVHLAAYKIPRYGGALKTLLVNSEGTKIVLECAYRLGLTVVLASTSDVYGKNAFPPFDEDHDLVLGSSQVMRWAYAASKIFDEHLALAYHKERELPVVILRFFGSYGPHNHRSWWGGPQAVFIEQALRHQPLTVHGDGQQIRTFCFVSDTVAAIKLAMENKDAIGNIFNIGSTEEIRIVDLAHRIIALTQSQSKIEFIPYESFAGRYEDVSVRIPDLTKAQMILGYRPQVNLEEGLAATIAWHRKFL